MLTRRRATEGRPLWALGLLAVLLAAVLVPLTGAGAARAGDDDCTVVNDDGTITWVCDDPGGGDHDPGKPGGGGGKPTCLLRSPATFCMGTVPCYYGDWFAPLIVPPKPETKPGDPEPKLVARFCADPPMGPFIATPMWLTDGQQPVDLVTPARQFLGQLLLARPTLHANPAGRTLVNLSTYWWAEGVPAAVDGTQVGPLRASAEPVSFTVDPGDGSGPVSCPVVVRTAAEAGQGCAHTYGRASISGRARTASGDPAYAASATILWRVRFTYQGRAVDIGGLTDANGVVLDLDAVPMRSTELPVAVAEVQAVVTDVG